jgi:Transposase DDE domain group 1
MRRFAITQSDTATLTSHAGLALVGQALRHTRLVSDLAAVALRHGIAHADCVRSYVGLLTTGKSDFDAIENRRGDDFFRTSLGLGQVPSAPSLRQRFDDRAEAFIPHVDTATVDFVANVGAPVTPLVIKWGSSLRPQKQKFVTLDIDVTPMDNSKTKKEGVGWTYKGFVGYAPIAAYLGQEGWCLGFELRPGSQNGQCEFKHFLERVLPRAKRLTKLSLLVRLDSGHDAAENRAEFSEANVDFLMKWNPRRQNLGAWLARAEKVATWSTPREGKRIGIFSEMVEETWGGKTREFRRVIAVTERTIDKHGEKLLLPETTLEGWWTSLGEVMCSEAKIIALYCDHATSEQFHSEFKTDLDIERLPSGKFATNDLVLACAALATNILRWIGLEGLVGPQAPVRHEAKRRRLRTVMQELVCVAARVVESGRQLALSFSCACPAFPSFAAVYGKLAPD